MQRSKPLPKGQEWLLDGKDSLGYPLSREGICNGVGLAVILLLLSDYKNIDYQIEEINQLFLEINGAPHRLPVKITAALEKQKEIGQHKSQFSKKTRLAVKEALEETQDFLDQHPESTRPHEEIYTNILQKKLIAIRNERQKAPFLSKEEIRLMNIFILYDGIEALQHPEKYRELVEPDDKEAALKFLNFIAPEKLLKKGGLVSIPAFSDVYTIAELLPFIRQLHAALRDSDIKFPVAFSMDSSEKTTNHHINIIYNPKKDAWIVTDANNLPIRYSNNDSDLAFDVLDFLSKSSPFVDFSTTIYVAKKHLDQIKPIIDRLKLLPEFNYLNTNLLPLTNLDNNATEWPLLHKAVLRNHLLVVTQLLTDEAVDPNMENKDGLTAMHIAAQTNNDTLVKLLFFNGANLNPLMNVDTQALLNYAETLGLKSALRQLICLHYKSKIPRDLNDFTPLHLAVLFGHEKTVEVLLEAGCDISKTACGISAFELAKTMNQPTILATLEKQRLLDKTRNLSPNEQRKARKQINALTRGRYGPGMFGSGAESDSKDDASPPNPRKNM